MNTARIVVLAIAVCAGGVAAYLASSSEPKQAALPAAAPQMETTDVLVAKSDIALGQIVKPEDMQWQAWPAATASSSFIRRKDRADAVTQLTGSIARSPLLAGEPVRDTKLVKGNGSGFMAAILPTGMRAISTEISPETGAGGFILPNDRVDVLLSRRQKNPDSNGGSGQDTVSSETILSDIRVLAIDQTVAEKDGQKVVVGKTATLELKPKQAENLARARQSGTLSLALRSLADANGAKKTTDETDEKIVTIYRGADRDTYNCQADCQRRSGGGG
ncbi:Flp pilus assembly protein CpaB [Afipia sp. Root123D2]|jgi:pilus assembly protein CpaB|uniref:Flp pilus assembly protein CpaB n=1 Tax=Afipia sp. Root123D2 TaxID=1736436 RepID=UPI0006FFC959|nr:Flp pilus assembly protein CpaB [Afipia sp. Root123D2]KQW19055.1 Flp pilus assembly protein CpaB [Afipia sp. Root123D2]